MPHYIHEFSEWPEFQWNYETFAEKLAQLRHQQGRLLGRMEGFSFNFRQHSLLKTLTSDVVKTSEIEGDLLDTEQVRSSLARRLGIEIAALKPSDRHVDGVVEMMLDATGNFQAPLTAERLFAWHRSLFPTGASGMRRIRTGEWRDDAHGPMQVVSGPIGRERVHYEAPPAHRIDGEMGAFLDWFNGFNDTDWVLKAARAHLWFLTIHPFEDGNGRIARAIADLALARSEQSAERYYSMSSQIRVERSGYYSILESTQKGALNITPWLDWFLTCLSRAIAGAQSTLDGVLHRAQFWESIESMQESGDSENEVFSLNERQRHMLNRLLDGFEGKLTTTKWATLAKCSQDTALRDILPLVNRGILIRGAGGGRSTSYELAHWNSSHKHNDAEAPRTKPAIKAGFTKSLGATNASMR